MSLFDWFADRQKNAPTVRVTQEPEEGDGLWSKCPECSLVVYRKDLVANASVCKGCGHHNRIDSAGIRNRYSHGWNVKNGVRSAWPRSKKLPR